MQVNLHDARIHLSRYVERAPAGDEVVIARAGKPLVRLVPLDTPPRARQGGFLRGQAILRADLKADFASPQQRGHRWEVAIKTSLAHSDVQVNPLALRVAQASRERLTLLTADRTRLGYGDWVRWVGCAWIRGGRHSPVPQPL